MEKGARVAGREREKEKGRKDRSAPCVFSEKEREGKSNERGQENKRQQGMITGTARYARGSRNTRGRQRAGGGGG